MTSDSRATVVFEGLTVERPIKERLAGDVARALGLGVPRVSDGSSVDSTFLDRIYEALVGTPSGATDAYKKTARIMEALGLIYDPFWDTSGGSTVTSRAYSRMRTAITGRPRCFLVRGALGVVPTPDVHGEYSYSRKTSGHLNLTDAGPGSLVLVYRNDARGVPRFIARGEVEEIRSGWTGPWSVSFVDVARVDRGFAFESFGMDSPTKEIVEVTLETFRAMEVALGGNLPRTPAATTRDPGGEAIARRIVAQVPIPETWPPIVVPQARAGEALAMSAPEDPRYVEDPLTGRIESAHPSMPKLDRQAMRWAEERAVSVVIKALTKQGWSLRDDMQSAGVGFDLLFANYERELHVEVKGILGERLTFNMTPKESWRAENDADFVLIAVTNVLAVEDVGIHVITPHRLALAKRRVTGYRVAM